MDCFNLGAHTRPISTSSPEAQRWFNLGLNWCFGFNGEEGVKCFLKALEHDPTSVMAHWGAAYGSGPFYNLTWREHGEKEADAVARRASEHIAKARALSHCATDVENQLIEALARRFQKPHAVQPEDYDRWDDDYAAEMRRVFYNYSNDHDVMALFIEALITRTPRRLWNVKTGAPAKRSDVVEAVQVCERSIKMANDQGTRQHPAIVHLHIHAMEMSNTPQSAMASADALATLSSDAGHLNHMPGHIYVLCGDYEKARIASRKAICANDKFLAYAGPFTYYTVACCHDLHLMMHTCMFQGRYGEAIAAANKMCDLLTKEVLSVKDRPKFAMSLEGYYSMKTHVWVRFGRWKDIIKAPMPDDPELYLVTTAMFHYAKGVAHAALRNFSEAEEQRRFYHESLLRIPRSRRFFNNMAHHVLGVGEKMLDGELQYQLGNHKVAFEHLRESVRRDDNLEYIEPWAWMHPPRHALAALLMEQGHYDEAEQIYRDDLGLSGKIQRCAQHPDNVWSLHGLVECLQMRNDRVELHALQQRLACTLAMADMPITSSCMCRRTTTTPISCCT
jgi:tetratricopeptide (TPR) repeat protein